MKLSDTILGDRIAAMFKGEHGTGKSIAASSFPRPHFFFFEERWRSLYSYWLRVDPSRLSEITYDNLCGQSKYTVDQAIDKVLNRPEPKTIVLDSITSAGDEVLGKLLGKEGTRASGQEAGKKIGGIEVNELEDFNAEDSQFKEFRKKFFSYSGHVIWIAHVISVERKDTKGNIITPSRTIVTGAKKLAAKLPVFFDEIYHFQAIDGKYEFITKHGGSDYAKTSLPLETKFDFTDGSAYDLIMKNLNDNMDKLKDARKAQEELKARTKSL